MAKTDSQAQIFSEIAELARTLGNAHRISLLDHIAQGERSVERLAELCGLSIANASQHLQSLRRTGFVLNRRDGKRIMYRLGNGPVVTLLAALRGYAEFNRTEIGDVVLESRLDRSRLESISRKELISRLREKSVVLLDVRPEEEYAHGHLPGAVNIPVDQLEERLSELPTGMEIVAYCRGPYCVMSTAAVKLLNARSIKARRLEDGFPEWKAAGLRVERVS